MPEAVLVGTPGVKICRRFANGTEAFGIGNSWHDGYRHRLGNFVLQCEDVTETAVIPRRPNDIAGFGFYQLRGDADRLSVLCRLPSTR